MFNARVTEAALKKLRRFVVEESSKCVHETSRVLISSTSQNVNQLAPGESIESASFLAPEEMNDWQSLYFAQASLSMEQSFIGRSVVSTFLGFQQNDGYVPSVIIDGQARYNSCHCKPLLCQTLERELSFTGGAGDLSWREFIDPIEKYISYFQERRSGKYGLYYWNNAFESGMPNNLALLAPQEKQGLPDRESIAGRLLAVDLTTYLISEFIAFSRLTDHCGLPEPSNHYRKLADSTTASLEAHLWSDELGLYCNLDPVAHELIGVRSWTGLLPALLGIATPQRTKEIIERNILSEEHFLRPYGVASLAASNEFYSQARQGLYFRSIVPNWRGPVWILPNVLVVKCLTRNGYASQANDLAQRILLAMYADLECTGTLHESYDAETGEPLWQPHSIGWNALALELMELVEQSA